MKRIRETIVVEGRYDVNTIKQCVDAHVVETSGFGIFNDEEKRSLLLKLAEKNGIIILTDSDGAGFVIRNYLKGVVGNKNVKHAYIPEIHGKEKRKKEASKAGLLGVEGLSPEMIIDVLTRAGATFDDENESKPLAKITKQDMFSYGLSGGERSAFRRAELAKKLGLPKLLSANALLEAINMLISKEEFEKAISEIE